MRRRVTSDRRLQRASGVDLQRRAIRVRGVVQGVGFRPAMYRLAGGLGLAGFVRNDREGVWIEVQGEPPVIANVKVGRPDVKPTAPSHVRGVYEGNHASTLQRHKGIDEDGDRASATARRSTGIRPKDHDAIDPRMPKISPA